MRRLLLILLVFLLAACQPNPDTADWLPTIAPTPIPSPNALTLGQPATGTLTLANRFERWQFAGATDQPIIAEVSGGALTLTLLDPAGTEIASGAALDVTLPIGGVYILQVQLTSGEQADYMLTVIEKIIATPTPTLTPTPTATPDPFTNLGTTTQTELAAGEPIFGAFNTPDEQHLYTFHAAADDYVQVSMAGTSGELDPLLTLYDPNSVAIAVDDNSGGGVAARLTGIQLQQTGVYGIMATGGGGGAYELQLRIASEPFPITVNAADGSAITPTPGLILTPTPVPGVNGNQLVPYSPVSGALGRAGAVDRYIIQANIGDVFSVAARPTGGGLAPFIEMTSPSGAVVATGDTPDVNREVVIHSFEAPTTGAYVVFISGSADTAGRYELAYGTGATHSTIRMGEATPDITYEASMRRMGVRHDWYVRLNAGDTIRAGANSTDGVFDPVLELINPDGERVLQDDNAGGGLNAQLFSVRVPASGLYSLRVTAANPTSTGNYTLAWGYIQAAPTPTPSLTTALLFTVEDTITPNEPQSYPLLGRTDEHLIIEVEAAAGSGLDTLVELVTAEGVVFASDDDSGGELNPRLVTQLPAHGLYQIRVSVYNDGNNTGGNFVLRVRRGL